MSNTFIKTMTCGVLISDGTRLLICHPTNGKHWDIPKGRRDGPEMLGDAAVRELREETGIVLSSSDIKYIGVWDYKPTKTLALFSYRVIDMPDPSSCFCTSMFEHDGQQIPEMDEWAVVTWEEAIPRMNSQMSNILCEAKDMIW